MPDSGGHVGFGVSCFEKTSLEASVNRSRQVFLQRRCSVAPTGSPLASAMGAEGTVPACCVEDGVLPVPVTVPAGISHVALSGLRSRLASRSGSRSQNLPGVGVRGPPTHT